MQQNDCGCADAPALTRALDALELAHLDLFRGSDFDAIEGILRECPVVEFAAGETVLAGGQLQEQLYLLLSGRLLAYGETSGMPAYAVEPGMCAGELGILEGAPAHHTLIAEHDSRALVVDEPAFLTLINASHPVACNFILALTQRLRRHAEPAEHKQLQQQYQRLASVDHPTGLFNRRWIEEQLGRHITRSAMSNEALSLVIVNIDALGSVAERLGHEARNAVVRALAESMRGNVRPSDLLARYGTDQFVVVLPDTDLKAARIAAERLRGAIAATRICLGPGDALPPVTASLGLAQLQSFVSTNAFLSAAAAAAGRASESGGNCVAV